MTIEEYLRSSLQSFNLDEATLTDIVMESGLALGNEYDSSVRAQVGLALADAIESLIFRPRMSNISENGFSESWNYDNLAKYYMYLCRKWGKTPSSDVVSMLGIPTIIDKTSSW